RQHRESRFGARVATTRVTRGRPLAHLRMVRGAARRHPSGSVRLGRKAMTGGAVLQIRGAVPSTPVELITGATTLTQVVLVILAVLSLLSWAIMFALWRELARAQRTSLKFFRDFERATRLDEAGALAKVTAPNALTRLFMRAAHFVSDTRVRNQQTRERDAGETAARAPATLTGSQIETLHLLLETDAATERDRLGRFLPWLATIGSVSPLIGLLGTVLGVIDAFI